MQARVGILVGLALVPIMPLVVACGGGSAGPGRAGVGVNPLALVGTTEQGMRLRVDVVGESEVRLRLPADCRRADRPEGPDPTSLDRHPLTAEVADDRSFSIDESYVEDGTDGDEEHVDVRVAGRFADDGTAGGTFEVTGRWWNGESEEFSPPCATGTLGWAATEQAPAERDDVVVPLTDAAEVTTPVGDGLLVVIATGETLRIGPAGDGRRLDGGAPAPAPPTEEEYTGPEVIATEAEGPMLWQHGVAVVADGVWMPDPSGVLTRYELADGQATARVEAELGNVVAGHGALWTVVLDPWLRTYTLQKREPTTGEVLVTSPVLNGSLAVGPTDLWYAYGTLAGERLDRIDPETLATVETYEIDADLHQDVMAATTDQVWLLDRRHLSSVDPATGRQEVVDLPTTPDVMGSAGEGGRVWTIHVREAVARLIEGGQVIRTVDIPEGWWDVTTTDDGAVWLTGGRYDQPRVVRLDPTATATSPQD